MWCGVSDPDSELRAYLGLADSVKEVDARDYDKLRCVLGLLQGYVLLWLRLLGCSVARLLGSV